MKYIRFGNSGLKVSEIALGTWHLPSSNDVDSFNINKVDEPAALNIIKSAVDSGINFFDTANIYHGVMQNPDVYHTGNSERILGRALIGYDRESLVISTKIMGRMANHPNGMGLSRKYIRWQVNESLKRLKTDYIDILHMHMPDITTPIEETIDTLSSLVYQGCIYYAGESHFHPQDIIYILKYSRDVHLQMISMQEPYNLIDRYIEKDKMDIARVYGLGIMAYMPLAHGFLSGRYIKEVPPMSRGDNLSVYINNENIKILNEINEIARSLDASLAQISISYILKKSEIMNIPIVPVIGVTRVEQLNELVESLNIKIPEDYIKMLDDLSMQFKNKYIEDYKRIIKYNIN
ncbi:aldo/keto reductase [Picrophilus oshimae]|uniref:NADPH-dependent oxidoreductase n=1 Tax=Picrophilus torridus (strain ATCC 700027 / DSM 9790 / JCM 10055 / NBRC 100828 / KAW 2/3) TaxID=1122961 RepID=Q6KZW5_PICTO|nr:aldo/keto reductase [Picrophilus oshimae]AAT43737.1 NADPH-dependent oxidoreductase [Picrophilus oshimae DSM 9789]